MRDHLFVEIHFGNGNRSGVTANMLLHEFKNARKQCEFYIVHVRNHKTYKTNGPAMVTLTPDQFRWISLFVDKVRPAIVPQEDNVFLTYTGYVMKSGAISTQLHSLWVKAEIFDNNTTNRVCANVIRKSTTTISAIKRWETIWRWMT